MTWWRRKNKEAVVVTSAEATRAIYVSPDVHKVEIRLTIDTGEKVTLELDPRIAHKLLTQLIATHKAIHPEIVVPRASSPSW